jgi:hypothetical protein
MNAIKTQASNFAHFVKGLGFTVYLAKAGTYGFITDDTGERVLSFSFTDGASLCGNYGPPSQKSGTGWCLDKAPHQLQTQADVKRALYEHAPQWCGDGWTRYTSVEEHIKLYGNSSEYRKL